MARRIARRRPLLWLLLAVTAVLLVGRAVWPPGEPPPPPVAIEGREYQLERVVDGDTLLLANRARVRLIGVDTPETVQPGHPVEPWGPEATAFTRAFTERGTVRLQLDRERKDRYGRFLAYVWVDGRMLNEELLRAGLARAKLGYPYSEAMKRRFRRAEREAKEHQRGIWSRQAD